MPNCSICGKDAEYRVQTADNAFVPLCGVCYRREPAIAGRYILVLPSFVCNHPYRGGDKREGIISDVFWQSWHCLFCGVTTLFFVRGERELVVTLRG